MSVGNEPWEVYSALPYVEQDYTLRQSEVRSLIEEEMRRNPPTRNYLAHLPTPPVLFEKNPLLKAELARVSSGKAMKALDMARYELPTPQGNKQNDLAAWKKAVQNASSQLEHQQLRLQNLELLNVYGTNSWRLSNIDLEQTKNYLQKQLEQLQHEIEEINKQRKSFQVSSGKSISGLEEKWRELAHKNVEIEIACASLEAEVNAIRKSMGKDPLPNENGHMSSDNNDNMDTSTNID
eukprot:TRINITY_DN1873_c0_g1_i1.p1 TRINITY_DN1873_c0_g1~~TRINITY_DN1873_c0_g1_i1.p1  ORF type:complete len:237 (-),score=70.84 TRINITY_DN1873_c0_g1_i1:161-871(-)